MDKFDQEFLELKEGDMVELSYQRPFSGMVNYLKEKYITKKIQKIEDWNGVARYEYTFSALHRNKFFTQSDMTVYIPHIETNTPSTKYFVHKLTDVEVITGLL